MLCGNTCTHVAGGTSVPLLPPPLNPRGNTPFTQLDMVVDLAVFYVQQRY